MHELRLGGCKSASKSRRNLLWNGPRAWIPVLVGSKTQGVCVTNRVRDLPVLLRELKDSQGLTSRPTLPVIMSHLSVLLWPAIGRYIRKDVAWLLIDFRIVLIVEAMRPASFVRAVLVRVTKRV